MMDDMEEIRSKKTGKKIFIISILILILLMFAICFFIFLKNYEDDYILEEVTSYNYFKLYENEKYGIIDTKGNKLIDAKYDNIDIPNPSKPVFIVYSNYNSQTGEYETQVINDKNEKIFTQYKQVLPIKLKDSNSQIPYEKSVLLFVEDEKYGIINYEGEKIIDAKYTLVESLLYKEGCLLIKSDGKYGVVTINGKELVSIEYDSITADGYYDSETGYKKAGFIVGKKKDEGYRYGYINNKGKMLLDTEYNEINRITEIEDENVYLIASKNGQAGVYKNNELVLKHSYETIEYDRVNQIFIVQKNGKQGVVSSSGEEILKPEFGYIMISGEKINAEKDGSLSVYDIKGYKQNISNTTIIGTENKDYYITINENDKFGVVNKNYVSIIDNKYQYIEYAFDKYFIITDEDKVGLIGIDREIRIEPNYDVMQKIKGTKILQAMNSGDNASTFFNSNLQEVAKVEGATVTLEDSYVKILSENTRIYLDYEGNKLENTNIFENSKLFAYKVDGKWGFKDKEGNVKVKPIYDMVTEINEYGFAGIKKDNKWGVINEEGNIILKPTYEINWDEPEFINEYIKLNFGYGFYYYTKEIKN